MKTSTLTLAGVFESELEIIAETDDYPHVGDHLPMFDLLAQMQLLAQRLTGEFPITRTSMVTMRKVPRMLSVEVVFSDGSYIRSFGSGYSANWSIHNGR